MGAVLCELAIICYSAEVIGRGRQWMWVFFGRGCEASKESQRTVSDLSSNMSVHG
jgi:hypothetical protein